MSKVDPGYFLIQGLSADQSPWAALLKANRQTFPQVPHCTTEKERTVTTAVTLACLWQMILSPFLLISHVMTFPFTNTDVDRLWHEQSPRRTTNSVSIFYCLFPFFPASKRGRWWNLAFVFLYLKNLLEGERLLIINVLRWIKQWGHTCPVWTVGEQRHNINTEGFLFLF